MITTSADMSSSLISERILLHACVRVFGCMYYVITLKRHEKKSQQLSMSPVKLTIVTNDFRALQNRKVIEM